MRPVHGSVNVEGHGSHDIEAVELADGIYGALVDELDPETGLVVAEHQFDETCAPHQDTASVQTVLAEVLGVLEGLPNASVGNSKVHFAMMRLKGLLDRR